MATREEETAERLSLEQPVVSGVREAVRRNSGIQQKRAEPELIAECPDASEQQPDEALAEPTSQKSATKRFGDAAVRSARAVRRATRRVLRVLKFSYLQQRGVIPFAVLGKQLLSSYGRVQQAEPMVLEPRSVKELATFFRKAREEHESDPDARMPFCTFRAGGHSFHDQSLNNEVVISLRQLNGTIEIDPTAQTVIVGPGVTWGEIVTQTLEHQLVPHVVVTTSKATAAGTLASDGISRHSPIYGSESGHVAWLEIITPAEAEPRRLDHPAPDDEGEDAQLFRAVIGGFGYLGVITRICYRLLSVRDIDGPKDAPIRVVTRLMKEESFGEMVERQLALTAKQAHHRRDDTTESNRLTLDEWEHLDSATAEHKAIYSIAFLGDREDVDGQGAVYESWYERCHELQPYVVYHRSSRWRFLLELMASVSWIRKIGVKLMWRSMRHHSEKRTRFVDDVQDYLFFMDVNRRAKKLMEKLGLHMPVLQQTYVVPPDNTAVFLERAAEAMKRANIQPTLFDVLFMPSDRILMSASYGQEGFACSMAFEDIRTARKRRAVEALLERLSTQCRQLGGRVHFTKHVYAKPEDLRAMYSTQAEQFMLLKERHDPDGMLHNAFFERVFLGACEHLDEETPEPAAAV